MTAYDYDLFVIGGGSGGVRAARVAAALGKRVAIAEEYRFGGTCVIRGCVPKKLLVYGAHFAEDIHDARRFGWKVSDCEFDWNVLRDNVLAEVDRLEGLYGQTLDNHKVTVLRTRATVVGPQKVRLAGPGVALHEQAGRQQLLEIEPGCGAAGSRSHVDANLHPRTSLPLVSNIGRFVARRGLTAIPTAQTHPIRMDSVPRKTASVVANSARAAVPFG